MISIRKSLAFALAAALLGFAACGSKREPAEQALAAVEAKLSESGAQIEKYLPERYEEVSRSVASLRDAFAKEEFGDVVEGAAAAQDALRRAIADSRIKRAKVLVAMESEWKELTETMPAMIDAMDRKIASQRGRPPKGMERDNWKETIAVYDVARDSWAKAVESSNKSFESSVLAARDARATIVNIMELLDVKAS